VEQEAVKEAVDKGLLQPHGIPPNSKQQGTFRILCKNPNGLNNQIMGNQKLGKAIDIKDELDADGLLFCKHRLNLHHKDNKNNFKQMFQRKVDCRAVAANNVHQNVGRVQEGGTGMVAFGKSTGCITKTGKDAYGLGQWCWTLYGGSEGHNTSVVVAYNACKNSKRDSWTTYQQQQQFFITKKNNLTCPNKLFHQHLIQQLKKWHSKGDRIILFIDHNKHTYDGPLGRALGDMEGLRLQETVLRHTGKRTGATFFRGSKPINGLWVLSDIDITNVCVMPFGYGIGDHQMFVLDITMESQVGKNPTKVMRPAFRRLNSKMPQCGEGYLKSLESNIVHHRLLKQLNKVHRSSLPYEKKTKRLNIINREGRDYMRHAEKVCRKIKCCRIPYSPEASIWIHRAQVYYSIIRWHKGKIRN
jgi:hypothetical protein